MRSFSHAAHVSSAEYALQRPQHNHNQQNHECNEQDHPLPVRQSAHQAVSPAPSLDGRFYRFVGPNVNADAEGRGTVGDPCPCVLPGGLVAQLLSLQPDGLLLLLVAGQFAQDLMARGQRWRSLLGQHGEVTAEGAREACAAMVTVLVGQRDRHEARKALQAKGVGAVQQLGCFEDIVIGVEADGALRLVGH